MRHYRAKHDKCVSAGTMFLARGTAARRVRGVSDIRESLGSVLQHATFFGFVSTNEAMPRGDGEGCWVGAE